MKSVIKGCAVLVVISILFVCCDEENKVTGPRKGIEWPDRSEKEDCVDIIVMAYEYENIEKYAELLLEPDTSGAFPDGYIWYHQQHDIINGRVSENSLDYYQDIVATESLFAHADSLCLEIYTGDWDSLGFFRSKPCSNCWQTIRGYHLFARMDNGMNYSCNYLIRLVIGPDPEDSGKYLIYEAEDLQLGAAKLPSDSEYTSLGELKSKYLNR